MAFGLLFFASLCLEVASGSLISVNTGLSVERGRAAFLQPENLAVRPTARTTGSSRCLFTVLATDTTTSRFGSLYPTTFDCTVPPNRVQYFHLGSPRATRDRLAIELRFFAANATIVELVDVIVTVVEPARDRVVANVKIDALTVDRLAGQSQAIDERVVDFLYNRRSISCRLSTLAIPRDAPSYGRLVGARVDEPSVDCDEFLVAGTRYEHNGQRSPDVDYVPFSVELTDVDDDVVVATQRFWIRVDVSSADPNQPPSALIGSLFYITVNEFVTTAVTPSTLSVADGETPSRDVIIEIVRFPDSSSGVLFHADYPEAPLRAFRQSDIDDLKILFRSASVNSVQQTETELVAIDLEGSRSLPIIFTFYVQPMKTQSPVVTVNRGLFLLEGQSRVILPNVNLQIADADDRSAIRLTATRGPRWGRLLVGGTRRIGFPIRDFDDGIVVYEHDHGDERRDDIEFVAIDGDGNDVRFLFQIRVEPVDDQPPYLVNQVIVSVRKGGHVLIRTSDLKAEDAESEDSAIVYVIKTFPMYGTLSRHPKGIYRKKLADENVKTFTQSDINNGLIYYKHNGGSVRSINPPFDFFSFVVTDDNVPPNESDLTTFTISVSSADIYRPVKSVDATLELFADEGGEKALNRRALSYRDDDSDDDALVVQIVRAPYYVDDPRRRPRAGRLTRRYDDTGDVVVVEMFTQKEVNYEKIVYEAPRNEIGSRPRFVRFDFRVSDPAGNALRGVQSLNITLLPVNNQKPVVTTRPVVVSQGETVVISSRFLYATDVDTTSSEIAIRVAVQPLYGALTLSRSSNGDDDDDDDLRLRLNDLNRNRFSYVHDGTRRSTVDSFVVVVSDGVHYVQQVVTIRIELAPTEPPPSVVMISDVFLTVSEKGRVRLTESTLLSLVPANRLATSFRVSRQPRVGRIVVSGRIATIFDATQLAFGVVFYKHDGEIGSNEISDAFELIAIVNGEIVQNGTNVNVRIRPIDDDPPVIRTSARLVVNEGGRAAFSARHLNAVDRDSPDSAIRFVLNASCRYGFIEDLTPARGSEFVPIDVPRTEFPLAHVRAGNVRYVQSRHDGFELTIDRCHVRATDGKNWSPVKTIRINVEPVNDETPTIKVNEKLRVTEGETAVLPRNLLTIKDADVPGDTLTLQVTTRPRYGKLLNRRNETNEFAASAIDAGDVVYAHDDSESSRDSFRIRASDGVHASSDVVVVVDVSPVDDVPPRVVVNAGFTTYVGEVEYFTNRTLLALDVDSPKRRITYVVEYEHGEGLLASVNGEGQRRLGVGKNFTQADIDNGVILYKHIREQTDGAVKRDYFRFALTDGYSSPTDVFFFVTILPSASSSSKLRVVSKIARVREGGRLVITTDLLTASDGTATTKDIIFTVTSPPRSGRLERADAAGTPLAEFTQLNLAENKILYVHTSRGEEAYDAFDFRVTNGIQFFPRTFVVMIDPIDDSLPVVEFYPVDAKYGATTIFSLLDLNAVDADTAPDRVVYVLATVPAHGRLVRRTGNRYDSLEGRFSQRDVDDGLIGYEHDGDDDSSSSDSFRFFVSDGVNSGFHVHPDLRTVVTAAQTFRITIVGGSKSKPTVVASSIFGLVELADRSIGIVLSPFLQSSRGNETSEKLTYEVTTSPVHGHLVANGRAVTFTQADVSAGIVAYVLDLPYDEDVVSDSFSVVVTASDGAQSAPAVVRIDWAWIFIEKQDYVVREGDATHVDVVVLRRGSLDQSAFVSIAAIDETARNGVNFATSRAELLQFNPGDNRKTWRVEIKNDEEVAAGGQAVTLRIILSNALKALTFPGRNHSRISILEDDLFGKKRGLRGMALRKLSGYFS